MPGEKSLQHELDLVRSPRVQITYDVETNGAQVKKELPFVLGVMADLAGHVDPDKDQEPLKERAFVEINRDSFDKIMEAMEPRLALSVADKRPGKPAGSKLGFVLNFKSIEDFEPEKVVNNIPELKRLLEVRRKLSDLKLKVGSNDKLDKVLQQIIQSTDELKKRGGNAEGSSD